MNKLKQLTAAMFAIVLDPRAARIEKIEAGKLIAAIAGILLPDTNEALLSNRQAVELRLARQRIAEKMQRRRERKRLENRRHYLQRKLRQQQQTGPVLSNTTTENSGSEIKGEA